MKLLFCNCRYCRLGRKSKWNQSMIIGLKRSTRHRVRRLLRLGEYDKLPQKIAVPYTD